jgi:hypothetical protein
VEGCICTVGRRILVSFDGAVDGLENLRGVFLGVTREEGGAWRMDSWGRLEGALGRRDASLDISVNCVAAVCQRFGDEKSTPAASDQANTVFCVRLVRKPYNKNLGASAVKGRLGVQTLTWGSDFGGPAICHLLQRVEPVES